MERISTFFILTLAIISTGWGQTDSLNVFWDPNKESDMKEYRMYRSINSTSNFQIIQTITHPNIHAVDRLNIRPGNFYYYKLVAVNSSDNVSEFSETVGVALPKIYWSISQIQSGVASRISLDDIVTDLDHDYSQLELQISNAANIGISRSGNELILTPQPLNYNGNASFSIDVSDPDGFWDRKDVIVQVVDQVQNIFTLKFPNISFPAEQQFVLWLDSCITISPFTRSQISWSFSAGNNITINYNSENRRVTFSSKSGWSGQETISVSATNPNQEVKTVDLVVTSRPANSEIPEENESKPQVMVFPNPFRPTKGHEYVVFDNLPSGTFAISIYSLAGQMLFEKQLESLNLTRWQWNVAGNNGQRLGSGFYIFIIKGEGGNKIDSGKFVVIR